MAGTRRLIAASTSLLLVLTLTVPAAGADSDGDGLWDSFEKKYGLTDPQKQDTDRDGVIDSAEDNDGDGLSNRGEQRFKTNPRKRDTDGDGKSDAKEDNNRNGISNGREQDKRKVPADLRPGLRGDYSYPPLRADCQAWDRRADPVVCKFGPFGGKRVVLIGDSHAMMWSSPIRRAAVGNGWRFVTMIKAACPAMIGLHPAGQRIWNKGKTCRNWQWNVMDRLKASPPDLVIIVSSDRYSLVTARGKAIPKSQYPVWWRQSVKKTIAALPNSSEVLFLGPVPHNYLNPRKCMRDNRNDMSKCVSPKAGSSGRKVETALRVAAAANGAHFRTLYGKICSYAPCPVVQGNKLMWRDKTHISDTFAIQLQPSIKAVMEAALK